MISCDTAKDVHATVRCDAGVMEKEWRSETSLLEARPPECLEREFPQVVERSSLIVAAGYKDACLLLVKCVCLRVLNQRVTLPRRRVAVHHCHITVWQCRDLAPLPLHKIKDGKSLQVEHHFSRSTPEYVDVSIVNGNFVTIPADGLLGINFRPTFR